MTLHPTLMHVTEKIIERSKPTRSQYLQEMEAATCQNGPHRQGLTCGNLAHAFAASSELEKDRLSHNETANLAIITAYNDMLSAHQPYESYPDLIRVTAQKLGATAQVAAGVPAMCDGVTQGQDGMDLSLLSRDVIALSTAIGLSHNMFDAACYLGICDKIVPGLLMAALQFGHLPAIFIPAGPMPSGLENEEKARIRQLYAAGEVGRDELLKAESQSYHSPGTCTFYGTANTNQMLMEIMGLQLPGSSFVNPNTPLRRALTEEAVKCVLQNTALGKHPLPIKDIVDEKAIVNGLMGILVTGGSTNHTLHMMAIAQAAGIKLLWDDFSELSEIAPLLARVYPNGWADINHFHAAGGMAFLIHELASHGLIHGDVKTVFSKAIADYNQEPFLVNDQLSWKKMATGEDDDRPISGDTNVLRPANKPFQSTGGLKILKGNLGTSVIKISAVDPKHHFIQAPAKVFHGQDQFLEAFKAGELDMDFIAVIRFCGPKAMGMPELHKLTPSLGILQNKGFQVALVTDGRMSGASGKVPAAIHLTPESIDEGPIARINDGDVITLDAIKGELYHHVDTAEFVSRDVAFFDVEATQIGMGRKMFKNLRSRLSGAEQGSTFIF